MSTQKKSKKVITISVLRTAYQIAEVEEHTTTIKELKEWLKQYDDNDETPIYLSHDKGYSYGPFDIEKSKTETIEIE